ncbi:MAG: hypothetical protein ABFD54_08555 [Armatimonadota bacterium]|nr:hypothetical protein [bacterium]
MGIKKVVLTLILLAVLAAHCVADKITTDPNASPQIIRLAAQKSDKRLDTPVTYQKGYVRLHDVADDLTRTTGVKISAGQNKNNWKIRDIPLIVCVKNMPLGRLLKLVAAVAHVELVAEKLTTSDTEPQYRFYRKDKDQAAIDSGEDPAVEANKQLATWAWDTLVAYSKLPERELTIVPGKWDSDIRNRVDSSLIRISSELLASLGTDGRNKALSGEAVAITYKNSNQPELLRQLLSSICANPKSSSLPLESDGRRVIEWNDSDLENMSFSIKCMSCNGPYENAGLKFSVFGVPSEMTWDGRQERTTQSWEGNLMKMAKSAAATKELGLAPAPDFTEVFEKKDEFPLEGYRQMDLDKDLNSDPLKKEYTIKVESGKRYATFGDAYASFARELGLNVVAEDFMSQKCADSSWTLISPNLKISVGMALRRLRRISGGSPMWFIDSDGKTLVGWAGKWRGIHKNLVQEALLINLNKKMESTGAELDDLMPIIALTEAQYFEWVQGTEYFPGPIVFLPDSNFRPWWALYGSLSADDKTLARSEAGLPLAKFDTPWLGGILLGKLKDAQRFETRQPSSDSDNSRSPEGYFTNPDRLSKVTMRIVEVPVDSYQVWRYKSDGSNEQANGYSWGSKQKKHRYELRLIEQTEEGPHEISSRWDMTFPLFTPDKEFELIKKASGK